MNVCVYVGNNWIDLSKYLSTLELHNERSNLDGVIYIFSTILAL